MRNKTYNIKGNRESIHRSFQDKLDEIKKRNPEITSNAAAIELAINYYINNEGCIKELKLLKEKIKFIEEYIKKNI